MHELRACECTHRRETTTREMRDAVYRDEGVDGGTVDARGDRSGEDRGPSRDDDARARDDEDADADADASTTPRGETTLEGKDDDDGVVLANGGVVVPARAPRGTQAVSRFSGSRAAM